MLQIALCRLDEATESLSLARSEGENRQTIALGIELSIRKGDLVQARETLDALGASRDDVWLGHLEREIERARHQPACASAP
jgi:hypothetical protein